MSTPQREPDIIPPATLEQIRQLLGAGLDYVPDAAVEAAREAWAKHCDVNAWGLGGFVSAATGDETLLSALVCGQPLKLAERTDEVTPDHVVGG